MFSKDLYVRRRQKLSKEIENGLILIAGNNCLPRNYSANTYPFRQDSNFLYFSGIDVPGLMLVINCGTGKTTLYGNKPSEDDIIWMGKQITLTEWADKAGIEKVKLIRQLSSDIKKAKIVHFLPVYSSDRLLFLVELFQKPAKFISENHSINLIQAVVKQRSIKCQDEVSQIEEAINSTTYKLHVDAMKMAVPDIMEYEIAQHIESVILKNNCTSAYKTICSTHGEILHNETYSNRLQKGQMLLVDAGAESPMHYASDITRTTPVGGKYNQQQKNIYNIVLEALNRSVDAILPSKNYRDIHINASKIITSGLIEIGLMKGSAEEAVQLGAHALFFPHGLGHMMGLDVHDMEDLGEDFVGYSSTVKRSKQFGISYLRLARMLEPGFVITVEPGIYFIPELIQKWKSKNMFSEFINYSEVERHINFGGIRIEDNILVTNSGARVLGKPIPKELTEIEDLF